MKSKAIIKTVLFGLNIGAALSLLISAFAYLINPNTFLFPAFLGLVFLPILILNTVLVVIWLTIRPTYALINALAILASWTSIDRHINFTTSQQVHSEDDLKVMSFNVRLFDLYNWGGNEETKNEILAFLQEQPSDIYCFQEFFNTNSRQYFNTLDTLLDLKIAREYHEEFTSIMHNGKSKFGIATLSNHRILHRARVPLDTAVHNIAVYTDVLFRQDTIRVFNIHLASVHLSGLEKDINKHIESNDQEAQLKDLRIISERLSKGFKRRAKQAEVIRTFIEDSPYPVVVCGDLNDTPGSYAYAILSEGLQDAFRRKGSGTGTTYIGMYPLLRIDFILVDPRFKIQGFSTEQVEVSDHRPIITRLSLVED